MATTSSILSPTVRRFLSSPRLARLCTVGADGYPHVVPIYFARVGDEIIFGTDPDETKVRKALRNPKAAVVIGGDPDSDPSGYMIQGDLAVEPTPAALPSDGCCGDTRPPRTWRTLSPNG